MHQVSRILLRWRLRLSDAGEKSQRFFGPRKFGNGPNTASESTVSNTELSEFFGAH